MDATPCEDGLSRVRTPAPARKACSRHGTNLICSGSGFPAMVRTLNDPEPPR